MMLSWPVNTSAKQWTDIVYAVKVLGIRIQLCLIILRLPVTVYLCQINIEALGKRPHRGQVANNQTCIFIVHSIRIHPEINSMC